MNIRFSWVQYKPIQLIIKTLTLNNKITFQFVGGCVRDSILGIMPKDFDLASTLTPYENIQLLTKNSIKVIPYALNYGTILALVENFKFEITTLRKDITTFGRQAKVQLNNNYKTDAQRRDFTFNALYFNPLTFKISDYFNGTKDLKTGKVKFIGNISTRINEDYLRIIRFVRFYTFFGKIKISSLEKNIIINNVHKLLILSKERITLELTKIINHKNFSKGLKLLNELNISFTLFKQSKLHYIHLSKLNNLFNRLNNNTPSVMLKWLSLLDCPQNLNQYIKLTKKENKYVEDIIKIYPKLYNTKISYLLGYYKSALVIDSIFLALSKTNKKSKNYVYLNKLLKEAKHKQNFKFIITGKDLLSLNLPSKAIIGDLLLKLKIWGIEHNIQDKQLYLRKAIELIY